MLGWSSEKNQHNAQPLRAEQLRKLYFLLPAKTPSAHNGFNAVTVLS